MNAHSPARACAPAPVAPTAPAAGRIVLSSRAVCSGSLALVDEDHPWNVPDDALDLVPAWAIALAAAAATAAVAAWLARSARG